MRESVGQAKALAMNFFWQRGGGDFDGKLVLAPQKKKPPCVNCTPKVGHSILVIIFSREYLLARAMPTLTVIKHFDVIKNIATGIVSLSGDLFLYQFTLQ